MIFDSHSDIPADLFSYHQRGLNTHNIFKNFFLPNLKKYVPKGSLMVLWHRPIDKYTPYKTKEEMAENFNAFFNYSINFFNELEIKGNIKLIKDYNDIHPYLDDTNNSLPYPIILGIEGLCGIKNITMETIYNSGVRHIAMTWNDENEFATGVGANNNRGITNQGRELIDYIVEKHIILDVSHVNDKSFDEITSYTDHPIIASHSNSYSLCEHRRNLTDKQIETIASRNGIIGINQYKYFISAQKENQTLEYLMEHIDYMIKLIGSDNISCGFDFPLRSYDIEELLSYGPENFQGIHQTPEFINSLNQNYTKDIADKIAFKNFYRFLLKLQNKPK